MHSGAIQEISEEEHSFALFWYRFSHFTDPSWLIDAEQSPFIKALPSSGLTPYPLLCHALKLNTNPAFSKELVSDSSYNDSTYNFAKLLRICSRIDDYLIALKCCLFPEHYLSRKSAESNEAAHIQLNKKQIENLHQALSINTRRTDIADDTHAHQQVAVNCLLISLLELHQDVRARFYLALNKEQIDESMAFFANNFINTPHKVAPLTRIFKRVLNYIDDHFTSEQIHV